MIAGVLGFLWEHWGLLSLIGGGAGLLAFVPFAGPVLAFVGANWRWVLPLVAVVAIGLDDGRLRIVVANRDATVAELKGNIADMKRQQAENIAAAVRKVSAAKAEDAETSQRVISGLILAKQSLEERANAAETALAAAPETVTPPGCPKPIDTPVFQSFIAGLPRD